MWHLAAVQSSWSRCGNEAVPFQNLLRHNRDANGSASLSCVTFGMPRRLQVCIKDLEDLPPPVSYHMVFSRSLSPRPPVSLTGEDQGEESLGMFCKAWEPLARSKSRAFNVRDTLGIPAPTHSETLDTVICASAINQWESSREAGDTFCTTPACYLAQCPLLNNTHTVWTTRGQQEGYLQVISIAHNTDREQGVLNSFLRMRCSHLKQLRNTLKYHLASSDAAFKLRF